MHLVSKGWILFFRVSKQGPCFTALEVDGGDKRLVELELACKADCVAPQILFCLTSAEQVPSLCRVALRYLKLVTSSNFWPFMLTSALMFMLFVMTFLFSVLTSSPYAVALSMSLLVRS